jgi:hypothetical protein
MMAEDHAEQDADLRKRILLEIWRKKSRPLMLEKEGNVTVE